MNWLRSFLSNDSVFGRVMWRCGILIGANLLFIALSIPIVTIGAANAALHYTMLKTLRSNGQIPLFSTFFRGLKENFRQATIAWLILLALAAALVLELFWCSQFEAPVRWFGYGLLALLFVELVVGLYLFPTMVAFRASLKATPHRTAARQAMPFPPAALANFSTCNQQACEICKHI